MTLATVSRRSYYPEIREISQNNASEFIKRVTQYGLLCAILDLGIFERVQREAGVSRVLPGTLFFFGSLPFESNLPHLLIAMCIRGPDNYEKVSGAVSCFYNDFSHYIYS